LAGVFDTYWKLIYSVAIKSGLTESEARDVVQETVVAVAKQVREDRYDRKRGSFRNWLCLITRRRIIDHLRERTDPKLRHVAETRTQTRTDTIARVPDNARPASEAIWEEEWRKNFFDVAIEGPSANNPRQFQIFDLSVMRELPVMKITHLLKVNAAQVYLARHRVGALVKKEVQRLEARA
jgi:RNA polymerase sigma factor (sigma-70 family)